MLRKKGLRTDGVTQEEKACAFPGKEKQLLPESGIQLQTQIRAGHDQMPSPALLDSQKDRDPSLG